MARRRVRPAISESGQEGNDALHTPLDRTRIENAVLDMLRDGGLDSLSMRKIADVLGVKAPALYYHVKDKEQLLHWLAERISVDVPTPDESRSWREQLKEWASLFRLALLRYPDAVPIMNATFAASPSRLAHIEFLYRTLIKAGFENAHTPWLASMLKSYIYGYVEEESRLRSQAKEAALSQNEHGRRQQEKFESLSQERYPYLIRLAQYTTSADWDREFNFGLSVLLDGFEARLSKQSVASEAYRE
ncbi:TetR/AcrR family transcriptional regulator C-terminal domain-containing protein [Cohnella ginsengisoli]|uniref:TetR/AcrR family transcriptional regulator C-terminal domain-containing protein n=1 Tax=Cohnella ginsengisoli TaxID=425004 RepID=A0A9X4QPJ2_9BACL|nr:TetR/AcrR family transcriptional regulator C-terminal domain-containing protein [Cohnella ginsengisoli]MDG0793953.1 TetR/AcrR family transcriptional regulator C-terminal domain-containing protein [Cohnella ginsengisoli]